MRIKLSKMDKWVATISDVESHLAEFRRLLRGSAIQARQVLQKVFVGRIRMIPLEDGTGHELRARPRFNKLFQGLAIPVPEFLPEPGILRREHLGPEDTPDADREKLLKLGNAVGSPTGSVPLPALEMDGSVVWLVSF